MESFLDHVATQQDERCFVLWYLRRVLNAIDEGGDIWYDEGRAAAYCLVAKIRSTISNQTGLAE